MARLFALIIFVSVLIPCHTAEAGSPNYLVLKRSHPARVTPGYGQATSRTTYAWGWFGVHPHRQSHWQNSYYGIYTDKTVRWGR